MLSCARTAAALLALIFGVTLLASSAVSAATPRPSVAWSFSSGKVDAGTAVAVNYTTKSVTRAHSVKLQRQMGESGTWRSVTSLTLRGTAQKVTIKAPGIGRYVYRVAIFKAGRSTLLWASPTRTLLSYGRVDLGVLCNGSISTYICGTDFGGTIEVGDRTFDYAGRTNNNSNTKPPFWDNLVKFGKTTCRKIDLNFAARGPAQARTSTLQVIQGSTDAQSSSIENGQIGRLVATLDGTSFTVRGNNTGGDGLYANGFASCYSTSGK